MIEQFVLGLAIKKGLVNLPEMCLDCPWTETESEVIYNKENNTEDLLGGDGETYSGEIRNRAEFDKYVIFDLDSGCGWDYQIIFSLENKVEEE